VGRRSTAVILALALCVPGMTALAPVAAETPAPVGDLTLVAPAGQTAVKGGDDVSIQGTVESDASIDSATLTAYDTAGQVLGSYDVTARVAASGGTVSGALRLSCSLLPGCQNDDPVARAAINSYQLQIESTGGSGTETARSNALEFDEIRPRLAGYYLIAANKFEVQFTESVNDPERDSPADWEVDGQLQVTSVTGEGDSRILTTVDSFEPDDTPRVDYLPVPGSSVWPNAPYQDKAGNQLRAQRRFEAAADRTPPVIPTIDAIGGGATSRNGDDEAEPVQGRDTTPVVIIGTIVDGHTGRLFLDADDDGALDPATDTPVGEAVASGGTAEVTWPDDLALPDDTHRLFAIALDAAACNPNDSSAGSCPNASERSKDALYDLDTVAPVLIDPALASTASVTARFTESVTGPNDSADWSITGPDGNPGPTITGISGTGQTRQLQAVSVLPGSTLTYAPVGARLVDSHSNFMIDTTVEIIAAPLPVAVLLDAASTELDGPVGPLSAGYVENALSFRIELSEPVRDGETATITFEVLPGDATAVDDYTDPGQIVVTMSPGESGADVLVELVGDTVDEFDETLSLQVVEYSETVQIGDDLAIGTITDDDPLALLRVADASATEGATATATVSLDVASGKPVTAEFMLRSGTATPGADYSDATGSVMIPAGDLSATIDIATIDDALDEEDTETFELVLMNVVHAEVADDTATIGVLDDDAMPSVRITDLSVFEGDVSREERLVVTLSEVSGRDVTFDYVSANGSATSTQDYEAASGSVTIPAGAPSRFLTLTILGDTVAEADEDLTVTLSDVTNAAAGDIQSSITLINDDGALPPVTLEVVGRTVDEGSAPFGGLLGPAQVTWAMELSEAVSADVRVTVRTTNTGSAKSGADFEQLDVVVQIPAGQTTADVTVDVLDDTLDEDDELIALEIDRPVGLVLAGGGATETVTSTITDDDELPTIAFEEGSAAVTVTEGDSATLTVELDSPSGRDLTVSWSTSYNEDASTSDASQQSGTATIFTGETTQTFDVATNDDPEEEGDESFGVVLSFPENAELDGARTTTARITVSDNDVLASMLRMTGGTVGEADGGALGFLAPAQLAWDLSLSTASDVDVTVDWSTIDTGEAVAGSDYTAASGSLVIAAGETSARLMVEVNDDDLDEFDEDIVLRLSNIRGGVLAGGGVQLDVPGTITDDDALAVVSLSGDQSVGEGEPATFDISLDTVSGKPIVVRLRTVDGSAGPSDYRSVDRNLTIPAGQTSGTVTIQSLDDSLVEDDERLALQLSVVNDDTAALGRDIATLTISDNDLPVTDADAIAVSLTGASVDEGSPLLAGPLPLGSGGTLGFVVRLSRAAADDIEVVYKTRSMTADDGDDFVATSGIVTIPAGATEVMIPVDVVADDRDEDDEDLELRIVSAETARSGSSTASGSGSPTIPADGLVRTGRILDDDAASALRIGDTGAIEGNDAVLDVSLDRASGRTIQVMWRVIDGTASSDDVGATSGTLTFGPGDTRKSITLPTIADGVTEGIEQLQVELRSPTNATLADRFGSVAIVDVGGPPLITIGDEAEAEGDRFDKLVGVTATLTSPSATDTNVTWTSQQRTATPGEDYIAPGGTIVIPAGAISGQIIVTFVGDTQVEPDEEFLILVTASDAFIADSLARVLIENDDVAAGTDDGDTGPDDGDADRDDGDSDPGSGDSRPDDGAAVLVDNDELGAPDSRNDVGDKNLPATGGGAAALAAAMLGLGSLIHRRRD
jgi:hypothetical protein